MKHHEVGYVENIVICIQNPKNYKSRTISTAARPPDSGPIGSGHSDNDNDKASIDIEDVGAKAPSMGTTMPSGRLKIQLKTTEPVPLSSTYSTMTRRRSAIVNWTILLYTNPSDSNKMDRNHNEAGTASNADEAITSKGAGGYSYIFTTA